jgi:hypothetical protein
MIRENSELYNYNIDYLGLAIFAAFVVGFIIRLWWVSQ